MILTIPINPEMRIRLACAETMTLDVSGHPELAGLKADLVAAHAHIELLHKLWGKYCQDKTLGGTFNLTHRIWEVVKDWEESQC